MLNFILFPSFRQIVPARLTLSLIAILSCTFCVAGLADPETARGRVFHDVNRNGQLDTGESGIANVLVSNQKEVVKTDLKGYWKLPCDDDTTFFVLKPRGWMTPVNENRLPQFYYTHKPNGSPPNSRFPGVDPTGPLPESIDFPLHRQPEPDRFHAIFFADPQPRNQKEIDYIAHDVVEELVGTDASFGVTLGDILFDDLSLFESLNATVALVGIPWYNVLGNHDINYDAPDDQHSDETFERYYGPNYYSFDHGQVHFIVLDDVTWGGVKPEGSGSYTGGLGPDQIEFVKNDLAHVPEEKLVVLMMHIPLTNVGDRQELYRVIEQRPYTMSISGHTHWHEHKFITQEDGWRGPEPHHHVINVTVSGSWWSGAPDENGIPHTLMRDGAPNGYSIITFDGNKATVDFKAARRPADYQMNIFAPEKITTGDDNISFVYANVFNGSERSIVEMRVEPSTDWVPMRRVEEHDPYYEMLKKEESENPPEHWRQLPGIIPSSHLWKAPLAGSFKPGTHQIEVRTIDMYGRTYNSHRVIRVE